MIVLALLFGLLGGFIGYDYGHDQCSKDQRIEALEYQLHELEMALE